MKNSYTKKQILIEIIKDLKKRSRYFSSQAILNILKEKELTINYPTLKIYFWRLLKSGVIFDAGRGWYSSLKEPFKLNTQPVRSIVRKIKKEFPLLEFSCWSTEQLNPFTHHVMTKFVTFVYTENDYINALAESLQDSGYNVYADPTKTEIEKSFTIKNKTVIILPAVTKQPDTGNNYAPIEKIVIDFLMENRRFKFMDEEEAENVVINILNSGRINIAAMLSYAKRRKFDTSRIVNQFQLNKKSGDS